MTGVDLLYSDTERSLSAALDDLLTARLAPEYLIARTEQPETYDVALWKALAADIGIAGLLVPEALGGAGASYRELAAAAERFGAHLAPVPYLGSAAVATAATLAAARSAVSGASGAPGGPGSSSSGASAAARMFAAARQRAAGDQGSAGDQGGAGSAGQQERAGAGAPRCGGGG